MSGSTPPDTQVTCLYKVTKPVEGLMFHPRVFWRSLDWESSTDKPRDGYVKECVLYAGDFDEVSIHLLPRVRVVRVRPEDAADRLLRELGLQATESVRAHIYVERRHQPEVVSFSPTIYRFRSQGFTRVRRGEYVSRTPQQAISAETLSFPEAASRWNVEICYVDSLDEVTSKLSTAGIYFEVQT